MADFKISRIRYTWLGNWTTATLYKKDDIIRYGGSSFVCIRQHTASANFYTDLNYIPPGDTIPQPAWLKMTEGYEWRGTWQTSTLYNSGDIVLYGGVIYANVTSHTSGATFAENSDKWAVYLSGNKWQADWTDSTRYGIGDVVKYNGIVYRCTTEHTSSGPTDGLENDISNWQVLFENVEYKGDWATSTRYRPNDLVEYFGSVFRCNTGHTSGNFTGTEWDIEFPGYGFRDEWSSSAYYGIGNLVRNGGYIYRAKRNNINSAPGSDDYTASLDWEVISKGINYVGAYNSTATYRTGDIINRGGNLYVATLDALGDGSTLGYLDDSNWQIVSTGFNHRDTWTLGVTYSVGDVISFIGSAYICNTEHDSSNDNFPGDNGSGFFYWDELVTAGENTGLQSRGDLLTYDLNRTVQGDGSSFGITRLAIGDAYQLLKVDNEGSLEYTTFGDIPRSTYTDNSGTQFNELYGPPSYNEGLTPASGTTSLRYVDPNGLDEPNRGTIFAPYKTVRYACERVEAEGYQGETKILISTGLYEETLPIIVPAYTSLVGQEVRSVKIKANSAIEALANDYTYSLEALDRISGVIENTISGASVTKTPGNTEDQVVITKEVTVNVSFDPPQFDLAGFEIYESTYIDTVPITTDSQAARDIQHLISEITAYINFYIAGTGVEPTVTGTNTAVTLEGYVNAVTVLNANKNFLAKEAVAYIRQQYPSYNFDSARCERDVKAYIDAWAYDIIYTGNYKSILAARYYRNAVNGSQTEDMFYVRNATGIRNMTLDGLSGTLNPPNVFDLYQRPTGGAYVSLDPGWGPNDNRTWITSRSCYVQNVTTQGYACTGQKIDGAIHNGGNKSIVSNDFTQLISDGIGAHVLNNGRAELVSVFTYYSQVGYLAEAGGIIRATNGNNSYGNYGALATGNDLSETPQSGTVNNRNQEAIIATAFAGEVNDEILALEFTNCGQNYTSATYSFVGSGVNAIAVADEFRDQAVFESRIIDPPDSGSAGGGGYTFVGNNAQIGDLDSITIASNDPNTEADYLGMRIILTSGSGTGQYGIVESYDDVSKVVTVVRESDGLPGWDHVSPGTPLVNPLTTSTVYRIEPRVEFSAPPYSTTDVTLGLSVDYQKSVYGPTYETFANVLGEEGTGFTTGVTETIATFDIIKNGTEYTVTIDNAGAGYALNDTITITGDNIGGETPANDIEITVTAITDDSTNSISAFTFEGTPGPGRFVVTANSTNRAFISTTGDTWTEVTLPAIGNWTCLAAGGNGFVAIRGSGTVGAYSSDGETWTSTTLPNRDWNSIAYGDGVFVAVAGNLDAVAISDDGGETWTSSTIPDIGDSSYNEWIDVTYGKGKFVAIANSNNIAAYSSDGGTTWNTTIMDVVADSSSKDWVSVTYGNDKFVAMSSTGDVAYSFDGSFWYPGTMPTQDGSTAMTWREIKYGQGVFFAVCDTGGATIGGDPTGGATTFAAQSYDGVTWVSKDLSSSQFWNGIGFGNPNNVPTWIAVATGTNTISKILTGARALGRVIVETGRVTAIRLWEPGSGYTSAPSLTLYDPNNTSDVYVTNRLGNGVLGNPGWTNRGVGYKTSTTVVTVTGNGFADVIPNDRYVTVSDLERYPKPGAQFRFTGNSELYTVVTVQELGSVNGFGGLTARFQISPVFSLSDGPSHETAVEIRLRYSQIRISGHDFLDIGTGGFTETNYPDLYATGNFISAPENEIFESNGGRVFYTSTDQNGNFRTGELFAVEQATGIVTISADFFDLGGLTELALGGVRLGGSGAVIREFSTDPLFTADSNNIVPTQRAIKAYLANRLSVGGSELSTASFIAGTVRIGPDLIGSTVSGKVRIPVLAVFDGPDVGISGSILAQNLFFTSFNDDSRKIY